MQPSFSIENLHKNFLVSGIDEAGRGPLAGPVVAACVILDRDNLIAGINDSKKLSKKQRKKIFLELREKVKFGVGIIDEKTIDRVNILEATKLAMLAAYLDLQKKYNLFCEVILVDGNFKPFVKRDKILEIIPIIRGDQKSLSIAAASIIAKETRDEIMENLHQEYPQFGFNKNAGYGTKFHIAAIRKFGICRHHRKSFEPIKGLNNANN